MRIPTLSRDLTLVAFAAALLVYQRAISAADPQDGTRLTTTAAPCPVTAPNGHRYSDESSGGNLSLGNDNFVTVLWPGGHVEFKPGGPGCVEPDGYLGMKWPWWRSVRGPLTIEGRRLDAPAGELRAHIPKGYGETGFQPTGLLFPGPGCWQVTGRVGDASLTFVTLVVKTGEGPAARCNAVFGGYRHPVHSRTREHD